MCNSNCIQTDYTFFMKTVVSGCVSDLGSGQSRWWSCSLLCWSSVPPSRPRSSTTRASSHLSLATVRHTDVNTYLTPPLVLFNLVFNVTDLIFFIKMSSVNRSKMMLLYQWTSVWHFYKRKRTHVRFDIFWKNDSKTKLKQIRDHGYCMLKPSLLTQIECQTETGVMTNVIWAAVPGVTWGVALWFMCACSAILNCSTDLSSLLYSSQASAISCITQTHTKSLVEYAEAP